MKRFSPVLRIALRRELKHGELSAHQAEAVTKFLAAKGKARRQARGLLLAECAGMKGYQAALNRAELEDSDTPIWDFIKKYLPQIIAAVIAIVIQLLL
jgi:hypothetical protein